MSIEVEIDKTGKYYHYETNEEVMVCPECKKTYKARKFCLDCYKKKEEKIETVRTIIKHEGSITLDLKKYNCDCVFGSWWRWGKHWRDNHPESRCKHCKNVMRKIEQMR